MKLKSCDVINMAFSESAKLHELYLEKKNLCDFDLFKLLCDELEFNVKAGIVKKNLASVIGFVAVYLSAELWDFDVYNV